MSVNGWELLEIWSREQRYTRVWQWQFFFNAKKLKGGDVRGLGGGVRADLTAWGEYVVWHFLEWNRFISCIFQSEHGVSHCLHSKNFTSTVSNYLSWLAGKTQSWRFPSLNTMKLGSESMLLASVCKVCSSVSLSRCTYSKKNHLRNADIHTLTHTRTAVPHTFADCL